MGRKLAVLSVAVAIAGIVAVGILQPAVPVHSAGGDSSLPTRIVSLSPSITEVLFALGAGSRVVGVTTHCYYPPEAVRIPTVGRWLATNAEAVVALQPDLVLISSMESEMASRLKGLGVRCVVVQQDSVEDILESMEIIGAACGLPLEGRKLRQKTEAQLQGLASRVAKGPRPRVLVSLGRDFNSKTMDQVYVAGKTSFYSELVHLAGGDNSFPSAGFPYPAVSGEGIMQMNPDVILEIVPERNRKGLDTAVILSGWKELPDVAAVKRGRVYVLDGDYMAVPGPRLVEALKDIARALHPEVRL